VRVLKIFDDVFDVLEPTAAATPDQITETDVEAFIEERNKAKKSRDFKRSDEIRAQLLEKGVVLEDTKDGVRWKRK
jgi:cysteinyl-tRNA synthetase